MDEGMSTKAAILEICKLSISLCALGKLSAFYASGPGVEVGNDTLAGVAHLVSLAGDRVYELAEQIERGDARQKREGSAKRPRTLRPVRPAADVADPAQEHVQESPV